MEISAPWDQRGPQNWKSESTELNTKSSLQLCKPLGGQICVVVCVGQWSLLNNTFVMFGRRLDADADDSAQKNKNPLLGRVGEKHETLRLEEKTTDQVKTQITKLLLGDGSEPGLWVASTGAKRHTLCTGSKPSNIIIQPRLLSGASL